MPMKAMKMAMKAAKVATRKIATTKTAMTMQAMKAAMRAMKVATQKIATTKKKAMPLKAMKAAMKEETATAKIAMKAMKAAKVAAPRKAMKTRNRVVNRRLRDALMAAAPPKAKQTMKSIREAAIAQRQVAAVARAERRARAAGGPASGPHPRARDVDTSLPPPKDAVWWFADTRGVKSV